MYDDFRRALEELQKLTGKDRQYAQLWLVVWGVLFLARYVITGIVVFALGRRIIGAFAVAIKESQIQDKPR